MTKEKRLGRGLAALLGTPVDEMDGAAEAPPAAGGSEPAGQSSPVPAPEANSDRGAEDILQLNVHEIEGNPFQPRRDFSASEIGSLAESLKEHDMLQPILVRRVDGRYQLISGERRLRAAIHAGWSTIPARVREADDRLVAELAIVENLQRKDLNPIEKALSFKRYLDEHGCTQDDLARRIKIDRSTISNFMRLLELPAPVLDAIRTGCISAGHARALLPLGEEAEQIDFTERIRRDGLSVREIERLVQVRLAETSDDGAAAGGSGGRSRRTRSDHVASLEQELRMALGTRAELRQSGKGRGRIIIQFSSHEEFERLWQLLTGGDAGRSEAA